MTPEELHRLFYRTRFGRTLDRMGYLRFRHWPGALWAAYGEHGLARDRAAVWLYGEAQTIEFADEPLAQYRVRYRPDKAHLRAVEEPRVFETAYRSPQLALWALDDSEWRKVIRRRTTRPGNLGRNGPSNRSSSRSAMAEGVAEERRSRPHPFTAGMCGASYESV